MTKEEVIMAFQQATSKTSASQLLGYKFYNGVIGKEMDALIKEYNIDTSHFYPKKLVVIGVCPVCGIEFRVYKSHGRIKSCCSKECANKYFGAIRAKKQIKTTKSGKTLSEIMKQYYIDHPEKVRRGKGIYGPRPKLEETQSERMKRYYREHPETREKISKTMTGRKQSPEAIEKNRQAKLRAIAEGRHKGWQSRNITSYPEKFFMSVLANNNIQYEREKKEGKYFIDFAIEHKRIALEIDGKQHTYEDRKLKDEEKDKFLEENGWKVYRISWNQINNDEGKKLMKEKIDKFLEYYGV